MKNNYVNILVKSSPLKKKVHALTYVADDVDCPEFNFICRPVFVLEKHLSVIRKGPTAPPRLEMYKFEESTMAVSQQYVAPGSGDTSEVGVYKGSFTGADIWQSWNYHSDNSYPAFLNGLAPGQAYSSYAAFQASSWSNAPLGTAIDNTDISNFYNNDKTPFKSGDQMIIPIDVSELHEDWEINDHLIIEHNFQDTWGDVKKAVARVSIDDAFVDNTFVNAPAKNWGGVGMAQPHYITATVVSITGNFPLLATTPDDIYEVTLVQNPAIFKHKFPKFAYRYKYAWKMRCDL